MSCSPLNATTAKTIAIELGFDDCRITAAKDASGFLRLVHWLDAGYGGSMSYISDRLQAYRHPNGVMPATKSILMLLSSYHSPARIDEAATSTRIDACYGKVARYAASGHDYHDVLHERMKALIRRLHERDYSSSFRGVVDSAPLLEREFAQQAGLGWIGKNTMLISRTWGSYFFLSAVLCSTELEPDAAFESDHCGTCQACLDACPTQAFVEPRVLDATRCISYLTIENRSAPEAYLRSGINDWVFGCDICQEVCPWNRKAIYPAHTTLQAQPELRQLDLESILAMDQATFRKTYRKTPFWRAKLEGMQRNALVAMTNQKHARTQRWAEVFLTHADPNLRIVAAWSLTQVAPNQANYLVAAALSCEQDPIVAAELKRLQAEV